MNKYTVPTEEDFEPGSKESVLKNHLGITLKAEIEELETKQLEIVEEKIEAIYDEDHVFTVHDVCTIHRLWLEDIYPMAGNYRTVNMSKGEFLFAGVLQIPKLMIDFEKKYLLKYTPCKLTNMDELSYALAIVHVEFILIHPFRDGNGRVGRLLAMLMALQAGKPPLNFESIDQNQNLVGYDGYINAINKGLDGDYQAMQLIFKKILNTTV